MNQVNIAISVKNKALEKAFRNGTIYLSIDGVPGSPEVVSEAVEFRAASNGTIDISSSVMFPVVAGAVINKIYIGTGANSPSLAANKATIKLSPENVKEFENNGTFTINTLTIALV